MESSSLDPINRKPWLVLSTLVVISMLVLPTLLASDLHGIIHFGSIAMSFLLLSVSILTYFRTGMRRLLFVSGGFFLYALREIILFLDLVLTTSFEFSIPLVGAEATHFLSFLMLTFFAAGVLTR